MGRARDRGVRAGRAKAASCCIDCTITIHERLSGNVPNIYQIGPTAEHGVASEQSQSLFRVDNTAEVHGPPKFLSAIGTNTSLICLAVKESRCNAVLSQLTVQQSI